MIALYLLFLPPLFYCPIVSTSAAGAPVIDYVVDDRTPLYRRASRQAEPLPLSHISPTVLYLTVALGICCCYVTILFQLHSLSLSPLDYFPTSYAALYIKIIFSSGPLRFASHRLASGP